MSVSPALAQEWTDFTSKVDRFTVNLPGQPKVEEISVRCHQLRDGSNGCLLGYITTADGVEKIFD